jgi:hypothetical protein
MKQATTISYFVLDIILGKQPVQTIHRTSYTTYVNFIDAVAKITEAMIHAQDVQSCHLAFDLKTCLVPSDSLYNTSQMAAYNSFPLLYAAMVTDYRQSV